MLQELRMCRFMEAYEGYPLTIPLMDITTVCYGGPVYFCLSVLKMPKSR